MLKFYYSPRSSATGVHVVIEELGIPYEKVHIHLDQEEQRKPEFLAINPNGKVPSIVDGEIKMFESRAIVIYLGQRYGVEKGLWPRPGTTDAAEALSWCIWSQAEIGAAVMDCVFHGTDLDWALPKGERSAKALGQAKQQWSRAIEVLDRRLQGRDYLFGKSSTLVDNVVASSVGIGPMFAKLPITGNNVAEYLKRMQSRPAFAKVMSEQ